MSTLRAKRFARLPAEMLDVLQVIPAAVHPKVGACLESPLLLSDERLRAFSAGSTGSNGRVWSFTSSSDSAGAAEKCASPFPRQ